MNYSWLSLSPNSSRILPRLSVVIPCAKTVSATAVLFLTNSCLYCVSSGPEVRFGTFIIHLLFLAFSHTCCIQDTVYLGYFPIVTQFVVVIVYFHFSQIAGIKCQTIMLSYMHQTNCLYLFQLETAESSSTLLISKTSHCTCVTYFASLHYMTRECLLLFRTCCLHSSRRDFPRNLFFGFLVPFLFPEAFYAFERWNHIASWF